MARQEPAQVVGLGRADPVHGVAAGREEHRDRQPRRPGRLHHHLQPGARWPPRPARPAPPRRGSPRSGAPCGGTPTVPSPASTRTVWALLIPRSIPTSRRSCIRVSSLAVVACSGRSDGRRWITATVPRGWRPTTAPTHVLQPAPTSAGSGHFPHPGHPWPAKGGNQTNEARRTSAFPRGRLNATPGTSRDAHATLGPWCRSSTAVPYMRTTVHLGCGIGRRWGSVPWALAAVPSRRPRRRSIGPRAGRPPRAAGAQGSSTLLGGKTGRDGEEAGGERGGRVDRPGPVGAAQAGARGAA